MPGKRTSFDVAQLVFYNHQIGKSIQELSEMFSLTRQTIYNILNRAKNENRLEPKPTSGRPRKISDRAERVLLRKVDKTPQISTRTLASELKEECGVVVSHETIRQVMKKNKYTSRVAQKNHCFRHKTLKSDCLSRPCTLVNHLITGMTSYSATRPK